MAINPETQYPGRVAPASVDYPYGAARNPTIQGDGTNTPYEAALVNDLFGFQQALLGEAGAVPSGTPEKATLSQYLNALKKIFPRVAVDISALKALNIASLTDGSRAVIATTGRAGEFYWSSADYTTEVSADTVEALFVAPDSDATGASGAWRRVYTGAVNAAWGGASIGSTANEGIIEELINNYVKVKVDFIYQCSNTITLTANGAQLITETGGGLKQSATFTGILKQTTYAGSGPFDNYPLIYANGVDDVKFVNVDLDGNAAARAAAVGFSSSLVMAENCDDWKFKDCNAHDNLGDAPTLEGGALFFNGGEGHDFIRGSIHDITGEGWHVRADYCSVRGGRHFNSTSSLVGSQLKAGVSGSFGRGLSVAGGEYRDCPNGAAVSCNHLDSVVNGNRFENVRHAIIMGHRSTYASRSPASGSCASGNVIENTISAAIQLQYGLNMTVNGGSIRNFGTDADLTLSFAVQCVTWSGGGNIANIQIDNGPGGVRLSVDTSDVDETVTPEWKVSGCDINNIEGYGIRSDDCSGRVAINGNTLREVNISGVATRGAISVFTDYNNLNTNQVNTVISGNDIGDRTVDCQRAVSISISNQPDAIVRHKVLNNDAINATSGFVYSPPSLVYSDGNVLDAVSVP
jgi:hypothetical protein